MQSDTTDKKTIIKSKFYKSKNKITLNYKMTDEIKFKFK